MKDIFWLDYPLILFKKDQIFQLWPSTNLTVEKKLNALTRLVILLTLIGYAITSSSPNEAKPNQFFLNKDKVVINRDRQLTTAIN